MSLATKLAAAEPTATGPLWAGPQSDAKTGGVTQSMIGRYLSCKERFRVKVIEGLGQTEKFEAALEYGNMWHTAEESFAGRLHDNNPVEKAMTAAGWQSKVKEYAVKLLTKYPMQQDQVGHWYEMCLAQFPHYVSWWERHPDMERRTPLLAEQTFHVPYRLPSGRTAWLRGKWDSVDLVEGGTNDGIWLMENKTKSGIDVGKIGRQLDFDLQTMLYLIALEEHQGQPGQYRLGGEGIPRGARIKGVRYNVIRRSAHKSTDSMLKKLTEDVSNGRGGEWFARWNVEIGPDDVQRFKTQCLDPVLENLLDDYEWWYWCRSPYEFLNPQCLVSYMRDAVKCPNVFNYEQRKRIFTWHCNRHYRFPNGIYNPLSEGGESEVDHYLNTGSAAGLTKIKTLFPELEEA